MGGSSAAIFSPSETVCKMNVHQTQSTISFQSIISLIAMSMLMGCTAMTKSPESAINSTAQSQPMVQTESGDVQGSRDGDIHVYRGIPYAAPPVDALRWRAPQPVTPWQGVRLATTFGFNCTQPDNPKDNGIGAYASSEDCLTLNIWTPAVAAKDKSALPVMFWIHGGAFTSGSGSAALFDGRKLAERGVIVVTINYRLGYFGFFSHPLLSQEADKTNTLAPANFGLMDQIAALQWVQRNIARFGGDAKNVTLFGQSAGGVAVQHLMLSPAARGLFAKAIVQSGRGLERISSLATAQSTGRNLITRIDPNIQTVEALRAIPTEKINALGMPSIYDGFGPIVDGHTVMSSVREGFSNGRQVNIPLLVGFNDIELPVQFLGDTSKLEASILLTPANREKAIAAYGSEELFRAHIYGDYHYALPAIKIAEAHRRAGAPTFLYRFSFVSIAMQGRLKGAPHSSERQYVFGNLKSSPWPTTDIDADVARVVGDYWSSFAKTSKPSSTVAWPMFKTNAQILDIPSAIPAVHSIDEIAPRLNKVADLYKVAD
jgi:para-nitrobenzyl esterase